MEATPVYLCYECNTRHCLDNIQASDCSNCGGRKCKKLHGGDVLYSCNKCSKTNLCVDCFHLGKCCDMK